MKKLRLASALAFGTAGMAMAEAPIVLEQHVIPEKESPLHITRLIDPVTQEYCTITTVGSYRGAGIDRDCTNFFDEDLVTQANILELLTKTGNAWRPVKPDSFTDRTLDGFGDTLKNFGWKDAVPDGN